LLIAATLLSAMHSGIKATTNHMSKYSATTATYQESVTGASATAKTLTGEVGTTILAANIDGLKSLNEASKATADLAKRNLDSFSSDLTAIKDPREFVKEEVVKGASMVTKELEGGVSKLNECVNTVVEETKEFGNKFMNNIGEVEKEIEGQKEAVKSALADAEKRGEDAIAQSNAHHASEMMLVRDLEIQNASYVDDVVKCEEAVEDAPGMKYYGVDEFVYATVGEETIDREFDEEDKEKVKGGLRPVKVSVEIGVMELMSIDEKVKEKEKERKDMKKRENDENAAKTGMDKPAERRRSSIGLEPLLDVSKKEINSPKRMSAAAKRAKSPTRRRSVTSSRSKSPRPSTAGSSRSSRPTSTRARGSRSRNSSVTMTSKDC